MRAGEGRLRALVDTALDAILTLDERGIVETTNPAVERLFGFAEHEVVGRSIELLMPALDRGEHEEHGQHPARRVQTGVKRTVDSGGGGREVTGRRKDGTTFPLHLALCEMTVAGERLFAGIARDITGLKQAERALQARIEDLARSNRSLEQLASVLSHDLQEPLRMVASFTRLLAKRYRGRLDAEADELIGYALEGVTRMQAQIEGLLELARVGTGGEAFAPVDLEAALEEVRHELSAALEESAAELTHDPLPTIHGDGRQIVRVMKNLLANAVEFRARIPPRIHVGAARAETGWRISVRDNGIGIDPACAERLFGIFQRLHPRAEHPGTGIGLALCRKIVERHGGTIWLESVPGEGSTFCFTLPDRPPADVAMSSSTSSDSG